MFVLSDPFFTSHQILIKVIYTDSTRMIMSKSAQTKKKTVKQAVKAKKVMTSSRVISPSKNAPWHQKQFLLEHQDRLHKENPALKTLLYVMLAGMIVLIALLFMQGQNIGMW